MTDFICNENEFFNSSIINYYFGSNKMKTIRLIRQALIKEMKEFNSNKLLLNDIEKEKFLLENIFEYLEFYKEFISILSDDLKQRELDKYYKILNHYEKNVTLNYYTESDLKEKYNFTFNVFIDKYNLGYKKIYKNVNQLYKN